MAKKMDNVSDIYPLTPTQMGMLYHVLSEPDSEVYFEQIHCTLNGLLDVDKLVAAWQFVVDHHPALRTAFLWDGLDSPLQIVRQKVTVPWDLLDWRDGGNSHTDLDDLSSEYRLSGFDLTKAPLIKLVLVRLADETYQLIWNFHHLLLDGWSTHQVFNEAFTVYEMLVRGQEPFLPPVKPFRIYLAWLKKQDLGAAERFWRETLEGFTVQTPLNVEKYDTKSGIEYGEVEKELSSTTTTALKLFAQQGRVTLNTVLQGAWALLLGKYSGEDDVVFGNTFSGRPANLPGVEQMVGMFITTLPLRVQLPDDQLLESWLQQLQERHLAIRDYEYSPLVDVQRWSEIPAGQALFNSILVFENYPVASENSGNPIQVSDIHYREQSNYPLAVLVLPGDRLRLLAIYNRNRFEENSIGRLLTHLQTLLESMVENPQQELREISSLTPSEREQLLLTWNDTTSPEIGSKLLHMYVEEHAAKSPDATAVIAHDRSLTYAELDARSNTLAHQLIDRGVRPGTPVGLFVERSAEMLVGIVGILKAGGAYVPLEPTYPAERIAIALADTGAPVIVTQSQLVDRLPANEVVVITLVADLLDGDDSQNAPPETVVSLDDPAYIIYTSGSTGTPKGVVVSHRNLLVSTMAREGVYEGPVERFLLLSSFAFDSSMAGIFWTLSDGGALVLPEPDGEKDVHNLAAIINREKVTHTLALPSLYRLLLDYSPEDSLDSLQVVIVAGEACPPDLGRLHYEIIPGCDLYNEYGPTEATVWCSVYRLPRRSDGRPVPIGRPIPGSRLYILDRHHHPVPTGVPGELYVGGAGITSGYLNKPELTAERFLELDIAGHQGNGPVYRTGDLARWRADGQVEFLGRADDQVKIRGFRIEPGEIENVLNRHPGVQETAVIVAGGETQDPRLIAYVVPRQDVAGGDEDLRGYLQEHLPEYMVPSQLIFLDQFPNTPNGKLDRRALEEMDTRAQDGPPDGDFIGPRTEEEKILAAIWRDVLGVDRIGIHSGFFELGGDSLMTMRVIAQARQEGLDLTARQMFTEQTIERLAQAAAPDTDAGANPILLPVNEEGDRPPFFYAHGVFGDIASLTNVIPLLDADQPIYGLQAIGLNPDFAPDRSIEQMAARYVEAIRQVQPSGPYYLGGFCFGGVLAYEIARQFEQIGEHTALLAIIEGSAPREFHRRASLLNPQRVKIAWQAASYWAGGYEAYGGRRLGARIQSKLNTELAPGSDYNGRVDQNVEFDNMADYDANRPEIHFKLREINRGAVDAYIPQPINGRVTLIRARHLRLGHALFGEIDPERGWGSLARGGVSIRFVDGTHAGILKQPYAAQLAEELQKALHEAGNKI